jgi:thiamine biosynthesis lipoprotein
MATMQLSVAFCSILLLPSALPPSTVFEGTTPGGAVVQIEIVADPATAETSQRAAFDRVAESERLLAEATTALNLASGVARAVPVSPEILDLMVRARDFCVWSLGATSPLGGNLRDHWRAVAGSTVPPPPPAGALASAACDQLRIDRPRGTVSIAAGSRVDLGSFARGFAVDRAVALLQDRGVAAGWVAVDRVRRAFGAPPQTSAKKVGWPVELPQFEGFDGPLDVLRLDNQALAIAWRRDERGSEPLAFDHRTGSPAEGVWATLVITDLAVDAEALAATALALGSREGRYRIATLKPEPAVLWLLGRGTGRPLLEELRWSLGKRR